MSTYTEVFSTRSAFVYILQVFKQFLGTSATAWKCYRYTYNYRSYQLQSQLTVSTQGLVKYQQLRPSLSCIRYDALHMGKCEIVGIVD